MTLLIALLACTSASSEPTLRIGSAKVRVEIADTVETRARGLMHRDHLPDDAGMLFIYAQEHRLRFWMKDTRIPLSIAFANGKGTIVGMADMKPFDERSIMSSKPAKYALEVNKGWFQQNDIEIGDIIEGLPVDRNVE